MSINVNLADICKGKLYQVLGFEHADSDYAIKLHKMGFVKGTPVGLAPVKMVDPIVVEIRGGRVALRKQEARQILVEEL